MDSLFNVRSEQTGKEFIQTQKAFSITDHRIFLKEYVQNSKPLVLESECTDVASKWTNEYLTQTTQDGLEVDIDIAPPSTSGLFADTKEDRARLAIEEKVVPFVTLLDGSCKPSPDHYIYLQQQSWPFDIVFPNLSKDLKSCSSFLLREMSNCFLAKILWLGCSPTRSQLHFDRKDNFICQMCGKKEILLFAPEDTGFLYQKEPCNEDDLFNNRFSSINPNMSPKSFKEKYPHTSKASATRIILNPGDVLFVPKLWWHLVSSTPDHTRSINIMVNMFFETN